MLLTPENAKLLEERVMERLNKVHPDDSLRKDISKATIQAVIMTLQEYECMAEGHSS